MEKDYQDMSQRVALDGVEPTIAQRWSPRAYLAEAVSDDELALIFEAARLSHSCFNEQPWRFFTSTEASYGMFLDLLVEGNQAWAKSAPVIGIVTAHKQFARNGKENAFAAFDTGAAWMAMSLQARALGLYTHGMGGVHFDKVYTALDLDPEAYVVLCGFTLGKLDPAGVEDLSGRKATGEIWTSL